ncbi:MAG: hypothetical protein LH614_15715 [Pyrinomonadaceae bacterium]|nr:hypothetical protein [Pyrinomonadaceae bacterium]
MLEKISWENSRTAMFLQAGLILVLLFWLATAAFGQTTDTTQTATITTTEMQKSETPKAVMMPVLQNYKEVKIGATDDEVRDRLGKKAAIDDKDGFFYQFDDEMAQIRLDQDKKVRLIAITYTSENKNTPQFADVFGADVAAEPGADGKIYKLVRYPEAGYWVTYSRTAGDKPTVTVTMQKL